MKKKCYEKKKLLRKYIKRTKITKKTREKTFIFDKIFFNVKRKTFWIDLTCCSPSSTAITREREREKVKERKREREAGKKGIQREISSIACIRLKQAQKFKPNYFCLTYLYLS